MSIRLTSVYAEGEPTSVAAIKNSLESSGSRVSLVDFQGSLDMPKIEATAQRIFFPGGSCSQWDKDVSIEALDGILTSVQAGAEFVGICAGAYYGCKHVRFEHAPGVYIERERLYLNFFHGTAQGPLYPGNIPGNPEKSFELTTLAWKDGAMTQALMSGGGYFVPSDNDIEGETYEVLATYVGQPLERSRAIIRCFVGKGSATLCFPHLEWSAADLRSVVSLLETRVNESAKAILTKVRDAYTKDVEQSSKDFMKLMV